MIRVLTAFRRLLLAKGYGIDEIMGRIIKKDFFPGMNSKIIDMEIKLGFLEHDLKQMKKEKDRSDDKEERSKEKEAKELKKLIRQMKKNKKGIEKLIKSDFFDDHVEDLAKILQNKHSSKNRKIRYDEGFAEDLIMVIAEFLLTDPKTFDRWFSDHKKEDYINLDENDFKRTFKTVIDFRMKTEVKNVLLQRSFGFYPLTVDDEGLTQQDLLEERNSIELNPMEVKDFSTYKSDIDRLIKRKDLNNGILTALMEEWWKHVGDPTSEKSILQKMLKSPAVKNIKSDKTDEPISSTMIGKYYRYIKELITDYLIDERDMILPKSMLKKVNLAGKIDKIASDESDRIMTRKLIATYILAGVDLEEHNKLKNMVAMENRIVANIIKEK